MSDYLDQVAQDLRPVRAECCRCELGAPWAIDLPYQPGLRFHFVATGECWLIVAGRGPTRLDDGDLALIPRGTGHVIADPPGTVARGLNEVDRSQVAEATYRLRSGGPGQRTVVLCCTVEFNALRAGSLIGAMPEVLFVPRARTRDPALVSTLEQMTAEVASPRIGTSTVLARLADIVVLRALRLWMEDNAGSSTGWLAAMRDPQIGRALAAMHRRPGHPWTIDALADTAALSRSAFTARFISLLDISPARYVAEWRMQLATELLRERRLTIAEIASRLGYESDASFSRTFKRITGQSPSALRWNGRQDARRERQQRTD